GYAPALRHLADGVRVAVRCPSGHVLPRGVMGELVLEAEGGAHPTGDLAEMDRAGVIAYHGPAAQTVRWAGQALNIPSLERHLASHPGVAEAVVVCPKHRPAAFIVPVDGSGFDVREARLHLRRRSVPGEPRLPHVHIVAELPRLP